MADIQPEARVLDLGDTELPYLHYQGGEQTVVMMHATGFNPWLWHPIARRLTRRYTVLAPYFCDYRDTDPEKGGLSWMKLADDLCRMCERLDVVHPLLVGHSMGATVMTIAEAVHGPKAAGMVLFEPIFLPRDFYNVPIRTDQHPLASKSIKRRNHWENMTQAREYLKSKALFKNWDEEMLDLYIKYGMSTGETGGLQLTCSPHKEASLYMGGMPFDPWPMLPEISCPVLVVEGEISVNRGVIDLETATTRFQNAKYELIPGAGHLIPMEKPRQTVELISQFFDAL